MISNLEYYRLFLAAATLGSATRAADALHLTQSGVSQGIKKLENELGVSLFIRSRKGLELTPEGQLLLRHANKAFKELTIGERKLRDKTITNTNTLSIGATETVIRFFLTGALKHFRAEYPEISLRIMGSSVSSLCESLKNKTVDAAFLFSPIPDADMFTLIPISSVQDIPVAASASEFRAKTPEELAVLPLITVSEDNSVRSLLDTYFLNSGILLSPHITVMSMGNALHLTEKGLGITFVPDVMAEEKLSTGCLRQLPVNPLPPRRTLYFALLKDRPLLAVNQRILDLARDYIHEKRPGSIP